ncbi:DNA repair protein RecO [Shumkonia mesophila]|uniref:DNA repair protein RecO n=1 Tax=Shumkonia mesophila TaxID=2838854 RepID=UPI0029342B62|nr:DNA repair protein RecO [Shumkonia mesophila]
MEWTDEGIVLSARKHGETSAIVTLLTRAYGRHAGLVRGGAGKAARGILQPGNRVEAHWRARLAEHLGTLTCEMTHAFAAAVLDDAARLAALSSACAIAEAALPEREPFPSVYDGLLALLGAIENDVWPVAYVRWELGLLTQLGFGLDLSECAATGRNDQLAYVSPKSGRAVSLAAGEPYKGRLLALPAFLAGGGNGAGPGALLDGLRLTGHFLERHLFAPMGVPMPAARRRLEERLRHGAGAP